MQDRNVYRLNGQIRAAARRQHYAEANATQKPRLPTWIKIAAIVACIGLAGGLADAHAAKTAGAQQVEKKPGKR